MKEYVIGVDIGTAGTKSGVVDAEGNVIAVAYEESQLFHPKPGWVEQEMEDFYKTAVLTIRRAVDSSGIPSSRIAALAITGQMSGIGMIDKDWIPVAKYDSWLDTRCEPYITYMQEKAGLEVLKRTGCPPTYAHCPKILWWKHERPRIFKKIAKFVTAACYVAGKLAGLKAKDAFIDYTYLHYTGLADITKLSWDEELLKMFDIPEEKLSKIVHSKEVIGVLTPQAAQQCGLRPGTPIVAGAGDTSASYLGAGVVEPGILFDVAGTASVLASCTDRYSPDLQYKTIMCSRSVVEGLWNPIAFINGGGLCLRWFRDEIAHWERKEAEAMGRSPYEFLDNLAAHIPPGSDGLLFVPHLGGRVLPVHPHIRGCWIGFSWGQTKAHFYRAILESIAYEYYFYFKIMKELYPNIRFHEVRVLGGGARSALWNQIKADVLGLPYVVVNQKEPAILGAALVAGFGVGLFSDIAATSLRCTRVVSEITPRQEFHEFYQQYAQTYVQLLDELQNVYRRLGKLRGLSLPQPNE